MAKKISIWMLAFSFLLYLGCKDENSHPVELRFVETTDVHGSLFSYDFINNKVDPGSLGALSKYLDSIRGKDNREVVLLDNGDILQGQPPVYYDNYIDTSGMHIAAQILNYLNYDAGAVGNHDIEPGHAVYDKIKKEFKFPWLAANAIDTKTNKPYFKPYTVIEKAGAKIVILGMVTPAIPNWLPKEKYEGIRFEDMKKSAEKWIKIIKSREKPDMVVGLFHSGLGNVNEKKMKENAVLDVAEKVDGFDIIFYGHDHGKNMLKVQNQSGNSVWLLNPGANANYAAVADVTLKKKNNEFYLQKIETGFVNLNDYEPTNHFKSSFENYKNEIKDFVSEKVTYLPEDLMGGNALFGPSKWMQLIHEVQMKYTNADLSFSAPLSIYDKLEKGDVTTGDLFKFYRFRNLLYSIQLSGKEIHDYLEYSYADWFNTMNSTNEHLLKFKLDSSQKPAYSQEYGHYLLDGTYYNFDSAFGIDYVVDVSENEGERVTIKGFSNGEPFKMDQRYKVAINSYRANGGGGHLTKGAGLNKTEIERRIINVRDKDIRYLIMNQLEKNDTLNLKLHKNWEVHPVNWWKKTKLKDSLLLFKQN